MISGCSIVPVVTTEEGLQRTQTRVFVVGEQVAGILEEAAAADVEDHGESSCLLGDVGL